MAAILDVAMGPLDKVRGRVVPFARGRVLEVGLGTGLNLPHYDDVEQLVAIEPDPFMMRRARERALASGRAVSLLAASAESLPLPAESFDDVVLTFTLCTVPDPTRALLEVKRVLKPGGKLHWAEHVRASGRGAQRVQDALTPAWRRFAGGCHLNRDAARLIEQAGFLVENVRPDGRQAWTISPVMHGLAVKPPATAGA